MAVDGKRPVRSENIALCRRSDGGTMEVWRTVVGSSWSSYWSSDSVLPKAGGPGEVSKAGEPSEGSKAGEPSEGSKAGGPGEVLKAGGPGEVSFAGAGWGLVFDRVVANTSCFCALLSDGFCLVDLMPDLDAVM